MDLVWGKGVKKLAGFVGKLVSFPLLTPVQSRGLGPYMSQGGQDGLEYIVLIGHKSQKKEGF